VIDRERLLADDLLFPGYKQEIRFGALSLDGLGVTDYGSCSIVLKNLAISDRATVFEENSLDFCRSRKLGVGSPVPPGYRSVWDERDLLGCAKLCAQKNVEIAGGHVAKAIQVAEAFKNYRRVKPGNATALTDAGWAITRDIAGDVVCEAARLRADEGVSR
jgi:hypothetical protein